MLPLDQPAVVVSTPSEQLDTHTHAQAQTHIHAMHMHVIFCMGLAAMLVHGSSARACLQGLSSHACSLLPCTSMAAKPMHKMNVIMAHFDDCEALAGTQAGASAIHLRHTSLSVGQAVLSCHLRDLLT